tara:strand:+ start:234 stop:476 length:243 start_codon:yes stop_codon:yes gene_type:complete
MKRDNSELIDVAMSMIGTMNDQYVNSLVKTRPEPKYSYEFNNDLMAIRRLQAFVNFVRDHNPALFESAYRYVDETIVDNE